MSKAYVRVRSHRARSKLTMLIGCLPHGYFSWTKKGEWREIDLDKLDDACKIKGITKSKLPADARGYWR
jgi:hypothetical protein